MSCSRASVPSQTQTQAQPLPENLGRLGFKVTETSWLARAVWKVYGFVNPLFITPHLRDWVLNGLILYYSLFLIHSCIHSKKRWKDERAKTDVDSFINKQDDRRISLSRKFCVCSVLSLTGVSFPPAASVTPRMEAVTVVAGGEAVLAVTLDNIHAAKITWWVPFPLIHSFSSSRIRPCSPHPWTSGMVSTRLHPFV